MAVLCAVTLCALAIAGCGARSDEPSSAIKNLVSQARPIGAGPRFQPPVTGRPSSPCRRALGPRAAAHIEVFARDRVVIVPSGIGVEGSRTLDGRVAAARCYGPVVTLDPTGVVLSTPARRVTLRDVFAAWGLPLSRTGLAGFRAPPGGSVRAYRDGRRLAGSPGAIRVTRHAEIVLEIGPYVPPHTGYTFPSNP